MIVYTDYPIIELGDIPYQEAPIRECIILSYDNDKYCNVYFPHESKKIITEIKLGYLYTKPVRAGTPFTISSKEVHSFISNLLY